MHRVISTYYGIQFETVLAESLSCEKEVRTCILIFRFYFRFAFLSFSCVVLFAVRLSLNVIYFFLLQFTLRMTNKNLPRLFATIIVYFGVWDMRKITLIRWKIVRFSMKSVNIFN